MTGCKNCASNCFDIIFDKCVGYTGESFPGVPDGASIYDVFQAMLARIELLEEYIDCHTCGEDSGKITVPKTNLSGFSENYTYCASNITNTNVRYVVTPGKSNVSVQYSLEDIINNLPADYKVTKKDVRVYGQTGTTTLHVSTNKTVNSFSLEPNKFPVRMEAAVMVNTPCGTISLEKTVLINADLNGSYSSVLYIKDYGKPEDSDVTQEEFNEVVKGKVLLTERNVDSLKVPNVVGTTKVPIKSGASSEEIIQTLINQVDSLKE